ncbi:MULTISPECIES: Uma2 family endonuclease [unclassified Streptomyces]|uniref:Uma2 family endonuclease n=1 Tax=unclassified Streptomyces TaxID=2593676 RepID=UPI00036C25D5|nr:MULTISPECIES: Uma2 family endonuclease [unclassified Streptomyces]MYX32488.1 Uma2 family endonuclease [Streptomyces sp. SID8377]
MTAEPLPAWAIPPRGGFTSDDLDRIPDLPPHTELIDGSLVFVSPQKSFHSLAVYLLEQGLRATAPETLRVRREMSLVLNTRNRPEPDLVLVRAEAASDAADETGYQAADAVLVVEVVSPDSEERDRKRKPQLYAEAGIPHFWRVEKGGEGRLPVVYVFEREPATGAYVATGIHHDRLKVSVPFAVDIDLSGIDRL